MRLTLTLFSCLVMGAAVAAGQQRPAQTRAVPIELVCGPAASLSAPA